MLKTNSAPDNTADVYRASSGNRRVRGGGNRSRKRLCRARFSTALEAAATIKILRRVCFLNGLGKHRDCVEFMEANVGKVSRAHQLFGAALTQASLSADVMARADLVNSWRAIEVVADDLESTLDIVFSGDMQNVGDNPLAIRSSTGRLRAGLQWDSPITRLHC